MGLFGGSKKSAVVVEEKSGASCGSSSQEAVSYLFSTFGVGILGAYLSPSTAYQFYHKIAPLQSTISKIADAVGDLPLALRDQAEPDVLIKDAEVLKLLNKPSPLSTKKQFLTDMAISLMITREMYIVARGNVNSAPSELVFIHSYNVQITEDPLSTWPIQIYTNINGDRRYYYREEVDGRYRYFDKIRFNEIFPFISERNVAGNASYFRGVSPLSALKDELLSYAASVVGNTASMENSGRPSGIITPEDDDLAPEQYAELEKSIREAVVGSRNSGQVMLLPSRVTAAFEQWAPKDMDYETLQSNIKGNIWRLYSMPFPIVSESGQTYSNFSEAQTAFYDEAVNKSWFIIADALKWMMETRFDMEGLEIAYNPFEVPALKRRAVLMLRLRRN
jgi:HK97 family phage portal protein